MTMKNTRYLSDNYHSHFGGNVYPSDFNTDYPTSHNIANRIAADLRFDEQCRKNEEMRNQKDEESNRH